MQESSKINQQTKVTQIKLTIFIDFVQKGKTITI